MKKFRKRPVEIEAAQFDGTFSPELAQWCGGSLHRVVNPGAPNQAESYILGIRTLEGAMEASAGDWIIKGVADEFYPCKPAIFEQTYEPVDG